MNEPTSDKTKQFPLTTPMKTKEVLQKARDLIARPERRSNTMENKTKKALLELGDAFRQFSRNGRWGTCADCPRDSNQHVYPEFCEFTKRYDHLLTADGLADLWNTIISNRS